MFLCKSGSIGQQNSVLSAQSYYDFYDEPVPSANELLLTAYRDTTFHGQHSHTHHNRADTAHHISYTLRRDALKIRQTPGVITFCIRLLSASASPTASDLLEKEIQCLRLYVKLCPCRSHAEAQLNSFLTSALDAG